LLPRPHDSTPGPGAPRIRETSYKEFTLAAPQSGRFRVALAPRCLRRQQEVAYRNFAWTDVMPRLALGLCVIGLLSILVTVVLVMGDATLPGGVPPFAAAALAGLGGLSLVGGLWLLEPRGRQRQSLSG
jgi:hypothetical protein